MSRYTEIISIVINKLYLNEDPDEETRRHLKKYFGSDDEKVIKMCREVERLVRQGIYDEIMKLTK